MTEDCTFDMSAPEDQFLQAGFKPDYTAQTDDFTPDGGDDAFQTVCADVRFLVNQDFLRGSVSDEGFQNVPDMGAFDALRKWFFCNFVAGLLLDEKQTLRKWLIISTLTAT